MIYNYGMGNYIFQRNKDIHLRLQKVLKDLPGFCGEFFIGIEQITSPLTRLNYAYDLRVFFYFLINEVDYFKSKSVFDIDIEDLNNVTAQDLERYLQYLSYFKYYDKECGNNEKAKARKLSAVKRMFQYFFQKDKLKVNITEKVGSPKLHEKEIIRLERDEVVKLLNEAESGDRLTPGQKRFHNDFVRSRDVAILTLFLGTGIRISECVGLNVEDMDFETNSFKVTRKGGNEAFLYFSDEVASALKDYITVRAQRLKETQAQEPALFLSLQNKRISARAVQNLVKKYSSIVTPLKKISPHKLRSTYGTALYRETKDIYVVADVLGHKDVNTTKKHYAAISNEIRREAANKVKLRDKTD